MTLQPAARYRLRVAGHLGRHWSAWFGGLEMTREDDGTTSIAGVVADQAELHGLLTKVRDLGLTLLSVQVVDGAAGVEDPRSAPAVDVLLARSPAGLDRVEPAGRDVKGS